MSQRGVGYNGLIGLEAFCSAIIAPVVNALTASTLHCIDSANIAHHLLGFTKTGHSERWPIPAPSPAV